MCVVSMVMDHYTEKWSKDWSEYEKAWSQNFPLIPRPTPPLVPLFTQDEVINMKKLLERAKKYDIDNNEPDCELEEKKETLRKLAKQLGVEIEFV